ncbi:arabinofuranosidase catalytic domain-containing protein [Acinetobacter baumannii]|uniref:arabinofuranosidase catalytic domain-containing protein n=1 Tax=Acinetobacter baumannii TaxID=470 RepID=UPI003F57D5CC
MLILKSNTEYVGDVANLPFIPVLDSVSAIAAYSLRRLRRNYTGPAIEVVRSSDSQVKKIGFKGGVLDFSTLTDFSQGSDLRVAKWFDQSGNGFDLAVATASAQPMIAKSGNVIVDQKGKVAIEFNGSTHKLFDAANSLAPQLLNSLNFASLAVFTHTAVSQDTSNLRRILGFNYSSNQSIHKTSLYVSISPNNVSFGARGTMEANTTILSSGTDTQNSVVLSYFKGQQVGLKVNSEAIKISTHSTANTAGGNGRFVVGSSTVNAVESANFSGHMSEMILFNTNVADDLLLKLQSELYSYYR